MKHSSYGSVLAHLKVDLASKMLIVHSELVYWMVYYEPILQRWYCLFLRVIDCSLLDTSWWF